jgi:hypothetical protein
MAMIATMIEITSTSVATRREMRVRAIMTTTRIATIDGDRCSRSVGEGAVQKVPKSHITRLKSA